MKPHIETQINLLDIVLHQLSKSIRPKVDFHTPNMQTCWVWKGDFTEAKKQSRKRFDFSGNQICKFQTRALPLLRVGANRKIMVHRFLYNVFRQPALPVSHMEKHRCGDYACVNPWHWEAKFKDDVKRETTLWPEGTPLDSWFEFARGDFAEDSATVMANAIQAEKTKNQVIEVIKRTHELMSKQDLDAMAKQRAKPAETKPNPWLDVLVPPVIGDNDETIEEMRWERYRKPTEYYNAIPHYVAVLKKYKSNVDELNLSDEVRQLLADTFSCELPIVAVGREEDFRVLNCGFEDAEAFWKDVKPNNPSKGSDVLRQAKREKFHIFLWLKDLETSHEYRKIDMEFIDWNN